MRSNAGMANTRGRRLALCASLPPPVNTEAWLEYWFSSADFSSNVGKEIFTTQHPSVK